MRKEIKDECLWNNHFITIGGKSVFYKEWYNAGVRNLSALYSLAFKVSKNTKLSMFQFKINHSIIYTRVTLFRAKIVENDKCQACGSKQTLVHLLVECQYRICSNKRRDAYLIFHATSAALIRGRRLFKHCTRQIYFLNISFNGTLSIC